MTHHRRGLRRLLRDDELAEAIAVDFETAGLDGRRLAMLRYVTKLSRTPGAMRRDDFDGLLEAGFSDQDVLAIVEVAAYYAYVNRLADGLGVALEADSQAG